MAILHIMGICGLAKPSAQREERSNEPWDQTHLGTLFAAVLQVPAYLGGSIS